MRNCRVVIGLFVCLSFALAGCAGSNNVYSAYGIAGPTAPVLPPSAAVSATSSGAATSNLTFPAAGAFGGSVALGAGATIPPGTNVTARTANTAAPSLPPLTQVRRALDVAQTQIAVYFSLTFSNTVTLTALPAITVTLPPALVIAGSPYFVALYDPLRPSLGWQNGFEGPVNGAASMTFTGTGAFAFIGGVTYTFGVYVAAPNSAPTPAPVIAAISPPTMTATWLGFGTIGASAAQQVTIGEPGFTGAFTHSDTCTNIATISAAGPQNGPAATYTIVPTGNGTCLATFADASGASISTQVVVNVTNVTIQSKGIR